MRPIIVSRHPGTVEWLRATFPGLRDADVEPGNVTPDVVRGRIVIGNLPMALAAVCSEYYAVEFDGPPPRGAEYTADDMRAAGARLTRYVVTPYPVTEWF